MNAGFPEVGFTHPWWLTAGGAACLVSIALWYRYDARQDRSLTQFVSVHLKDRLTRSISLARRRTRRGLHLGVLALLFIALSGPWVGFRWERISRRGYDIVFAIDTSRSMSTPDVRPDRLTRAKLAIDDFAELLDGDAVGIVAFAGRAVLACPMTVDYGAFRESLGAIDTHLIPRGGTNISAAIEKAQIVLGQRQGSDKILILVTDGEDLEGESLAAARTAGQRGIKIYTVGVGTSAGDLIPIPPADGGGFVKDDHGTLVRSRLDETGLKALAGAAGGIYAPLGAQGEGLESIFRSIFGTVNRHDIDIRRRKIYIDRYQWPLGAAVALLLASPVIGDRRRRPGPVPQTAAGPPSATALSWLLVLAAGAAGFARAASTPDSEEASGAAAYRSGRFPQAARAFQQSLGQAPSSDARRLGLQQDAYYNLGNALYRSGQSTEKSDPNATIDQWTRAVKAYDTALQLRPDDADSKYNRELVQRKIDALRKPPPQNQNQNRPPPGGQPPPPSGSNRPSPPPSGGQGQPPPPPNASNQPPPPGGNSNRQPPPDDPRQQPPAGANDRREPGGMSPEEARELLDSEKDEEKHPLSVPRGPAGGPDEKTYKNW